MRGTVLWFGHAYISYVFVRMCINWKMTFLICCECDWLELLHKYIDIYFLCMMIYHTDVGTDSWLSSTIALRFYYQELHDKGLDACGNHKLYVIPMLFCHLFSVIWWHFAVDQSIVDPFNPSMNYSNIFLWFSMIVFRTNREPWHHKCIIAQEGVFYV